MEVFTRTSTELEERNKALNDPVALDTYRRASDGLRVSWLPRLLGGLLVGCGNLFYGREPSYLKFRAIEVIARVPYHSWASAAYTLLTLCYGNERRALELSKVARYAAFAQENETMHVVVITALARAEAHAGLVRHTVIPVAFAFFYFWAAYWLYLLSPRASYELDYLFEDHALRQYAKFIEMHEVELREKPVESEFLLWYGRSCATQYEFFRSVRNDEAIHRDSAFRAIAALKKRA